MISKNILINQKITTTAWYDENNQLHREDGPAVRWADGGESWYYHGRYITNKSQEEFKRIIELLIFK